MELSTPATELLTTVSQRNEYINSVITGTEPVSKQTLCNDLGFARSTVDEVIRNLCELGLFESTADGVVSTLFAVLVWETYETFNQQIAVVGASEGDAATDLWPTVAERQTVSELVAAQLDVLECAQEPHDKRDLVADLAVSRSTVDRAIRKLKMAELVAWTTDGYVTTAAGKQIAAQYRFTVESVADILAAQEVLTVLPNDCPIQPLLLTDATVEYTVDAPPYHLPANVRDQIVTAQRVRIYLPELATPQLLDCCQQQMIHEGLTLDLLASSSLLETLSIEFPGPLGAIAAVEYCTVFRADTALDQIPFGLMLAETDTTTSVSVIVYGEHRTIHGTIYNTATDSIQWANEKYSFIRDGATEMTDELRALIPDEKETATGSVVMDDTERIALRREGFVQLTPAYFGQRTPAPPVTGWRTGFDLIDVHAGYTIDRRIEHNGTHHNFTDRLTERLEAGMNLAIIGSPGSGKSTVCKSVACWWYEQGVGPVFYRESGRGTTLPSPSILSSHLRAADGHALVIVEDAVRAEANAIFQLMRSFRGVETVTFLLDARAEE